MICFSRLCGLPSGLRFIVTDRIVPECRQFTTAHHLRDQRSSPKPDHLDVADFLSRPSWSVSTLLPRSDHVSETPGVTPKQLRHLLRLSALPPPKDADEEQRMLDTLSSQLHFVKEIQSVDTEGIEPLRSLRDESKIGEQTAELGLDALRDALGQEEVRGKHHVRIRRRRGFQTMRKGDESGWDVLGTAEKKVGRFFVVEGGKEG